MDLLANLKASVSVTLVALPLSLALAVAGGARPLDGLKSAIWAGLIGSIFAGSQFTIFGPSAALAGVLVGTAAKFGQDSLPALAILAGIFSLLLWFLKLHRYATYIPGAVVHGFTIGVAFMLGAGQLKSGLGLNKMEPCPAESDDGSAWLALPVLKWFGDESSAGSGGPCMVVHHQFIFAFFETLRHIPDANLAITGFWLANSVALFAAGKLLPKVPWVIVICSIGMLLGWLQPFYLITFGHVYDDITDVKLFALPNFSAEIISFDFVVKAINLACIGILETLVSARISDCISHARHDQRREVLGFAVANSAAGLLGGIGVAGALARTALNIQSGATSRISGILCAIWILIFSLVASKLIGFLPPSTLAAILTVLSIRLVDLKVVKEIWKFDRKMFWIGALTMFLCVFWDIFLGVLLGMVLSMLVSFDQVAFGFADAKVISKSSTTNLRGVRLGSGFQLQSRVLNNPGVSLGESADVELTENSAAVLVYRVNDVLSHINGPQHEQRLHLLLKEYKVHFALIDLEHCPSVSLDGVNSLQTMAAMGNLYYTRAMDNSMGSAIPFLKKIHEEKRIFENKEQALEILQNVNADAIGSSDEEAGGPGRVLGDSMTDEEEEEEETGRLVH